jgi:hypothetical protein
MKCAAGSGMDVQVPEAATQCRKHCSEDVVVKKEGEDGRSGENNEVGCRFYLFVVFRFFGNILLIYGFLLSFM